MKKTGKKKVLQTILDFIIILIGSILYSAGIHFFTAPNDIAPGGVGGIATIINELTGLNIGMMYGIMNIPLLIIGLIFLGKKTMIKTVVAVASITFFTDYGFQFFDLPVYANGDKILASVFGGALIGLGLGLVYLREGTSGGTDIITKLINKRWQHFSIGTISLAIDAAIVISSMFVYKNIESGLYAIISIFICSKIMDVILYGSHESKMLLIFSDRYEEISQFIMTTMHRGVTILDGKGAYSGTGKNIICCAVHKNEYTKIKREVKEIDKNAFIIITNAGEVLGDGFAENA